MREVTRAEWNRSFNADVPEMPEIPECAGRAWDFWMRLNGRRSQGEDIQPITHCMMVSFETMCNVSILPEEVEMIEATDTAFISQMNRERREMHERMREESKGRK